MTADAVAEVERAMNAIRRSQSRRRLARLAGEHDPALFEIADAVAEHDEQGTACTVTGIAGRLGVDQPRASRLVAKAVDRGLVDRAADPGDARSSRLVPTAAGNAYVEQARMSRRELMDRAMSGWTADERAAFAGLLTRFVAAI